MDLHDEVIPVLARNCVDGMKVLRGVEIHGDRRSDLEAALVKLLSLWFTESEEIHAIALRSGRQHGLERSVFDRLRFIVWKRIGLSGHPPRPSRPVEIEEMDPDIAEVLEELLVDVSPAPTWRDPEPPILVQLCLDLIRSSDFAEIEATDEELAAALGAALADAPRTFTDFLERPRPVAVPRIRFVLPSPPDVVPLEESVRRFLDWLRGGGPPSDGPGGGSCPPPAVPA